MAIILDEPTLGEIVLDYALFVGAIFQLICIFAIIVLPPSAEEKSADSLQISPALVPHISTKSAHDHTSRRSKKEKKKHR